MIGGLNEEDQREALASLAASREQLIRLDPHPEAQGIDHAFQSLTFKDRIKDHLEQYLRE